jgi:membrane protein DedA with SNARE-associated domain
MLEILRPFIDFVTWVISNLGYPGIFFLMFLDSAMIPIPSEIILVFSGYLITSGVFEPVSVVLVGSLGNVLGSIVTYYIGLKWGRLMILRYGKYIFLKKKHLEYTENLFQRYGDKISFMGRLLPAIRTYISLPCGIGKTNLVKFSVYTFLGSVIWNTLFIYVGMQLGNNWQDIDKYSIYLDILLVSVITGFVIWFIIKKAIKHGYLNPRRYRFCFF